MLGPHSAAKYWAISTDACGNNRSTRSKASRESDTIWCPSEVIHLALVTDHASADLGRDAPEQACSRAIWVCRVKRGKKNSTTQPSQPPKLYLASTKAKPRSLSSDCHGITGLGAQDDLIAGLGVGCSRRLIDLR